MRQVLKSLLLPPVLVVFSYMVFFSYLHCDRAEAKQITWTNPRYYSETCGSDSVRAISESETGDLQVQMKPAAADSLLWISIAFIPEWIPGSVGTYDVDPPGYGSWDFRVIPIATDADGTLRRACPSNVWTWTITDTCVVQKVLDFGPVGP